MAFRKTRVIINVQNIVDNYLKLKALFKPKVNLLAVVKADAYGHGAVRVAQALEKETNAGFCVATVDEGIELRENGIRSQIFILGLSNKDSIAPAIQNNLILCISSVEQVSLIHKIASDLQRVAQVHVAINTGMNRIGLRDKNELKKIVEFCKTLDSVQIISTFTHLAFADENYEEIAYINDFTAQQIREYDSITNIFQLPRSLANSAGILRMKDYDFEYARAGIVMYGYPPVKTSLNLQPALEWHSEVVNITTVHKGETIGYGRSYKAEKDMLIATVAVGYGDGFDRAFSNKGRVIIKNSIANIVGRVCMDQIMVDITNISNVTIEDDVILLGKSQDLQLTAEDLAQTIDTISYEVLLSPSKRVEKIYI
ncbi:MAG: alanine racemase [Eubacteriales bacterium]|nr:alanine racemase [Eubacteriales bacterium]